MSDRKTSYYQRQRQNLLVKKHLVPYKYPQLAETWWKPPKYVSTQSIQLVRNGDHCVPMGFDLDSPHNSCQLDEDTLLGRLMEQWRVAGRGPMLAVCITMYNEDESELKSTLAGVMENHERMRAEGVPGFGKNDLVIFVIADGYEKIPNSMKRMLSEKKLFDIEILKKKGFMKRKEGRKKSWANKGLRQHTTPQFFGDNWEMKHVAQLSKEEEEVPSNVIHLFMARTWDFEIGPGAPHRWRVNFMFAVKQRNDGKINSHRCFFEGICQLINPKYTMMLDIGTRPKPNSILRLVRNLEARPKCGGCCGQIEADVHPDESEGFWSGYFLRAAQYYEYKISHSPDKACESMFGFCSVLPGAYSLFRWEAIQGSPLNEFYKGLQKDRLSCSEANKFLAQDRVMCLEVLIKKKSRYYLRYVPNAEAVTDVPNDLGTLLKQRRRWLNGSLFGTLYVLTNSCRLLSCCRARHPFILKVGFFFFLIYYAVSFLFFLLAFGWLYSMLSLFLASQLDAILLHSSNQVLHSLARNHLLAQIFSYVFFFILVMAMLASLTQPVDKAVCFFRIIVLILGLFVNFVFLSVLYYILRHGFYLPPDYQQINFLACAAVAIVANYIVPIILRPIDFICNIHKYIIGMLSYLFLLPTFSVLLQVYAFCNLHDISWGNRPNGGSQGIHTLTYDKMKQAVIALDYQVFRSRFLYTWFFINVIFGIVVTRILVPSNQEIEKQPTSIDTHTTAYKFLLISALTMAGIVAFKTISGMIYSIFSACLYMVDCCCPFDCYRARSPKSRHSFLRDEWNDKYENYIAFRDRFLHNLENAEVRVKKKEQDIDTPFYRWS